MRRVQANGAMVMVMRRGDKEAGSVMVRVNTLKGCSGLYVPFTGLDGERRWRPLADLQTGDEKINQIIAKEIKYDPDLWVVEIEDKKGRHFLEEPVDAA